MTLLGTKLFQISAGFFVPTFRHFMITFASYWRMHASKTCYESTDWVVSLCSAAGKIVPHQDYQQVTFCKKSRFYINGRSIRDWKITFQLQLAKNWILSTGIWWFSLSYKQSYPLFGIMQTTIENLEMLQSVNFDFIDSLKNNGTKQFLYFDCSCREKCNSKFFVDFATAGKYHGSSINYINKTCFIQVN